VNSKTKAPPARVKERDGVVTDAANVTLAAAEDKSSSTWNETFCWQLKAAPILVRVLRWIPVTNFTRRRLFLALRNFLRE